MKINYSQYNIGDLLVLRRAYAGFPATERVSVTDNQKKKFKREYCIKVADERNVEKYVPTKYLRKAK